ncbi:NAD-dependent epimerase/dehydratase family protein [Paenibacillus sp. Marseille-P2973]|uniref:NAD-dependent epimerase/dehydratase family protein n=1 Tax=Paenibacillus sp. Marseille-P2973 TaxID=1871032 RepID=UPI001B38DD67|nr:NAD-dependent epimerase/dehydratase family protein [Paenibacillus sp. Marseille-P2973]MBQ4900395.1 NAD-dependent epimerase/dehydratase family protein [Paenibacillus sp. Marseille-P2973]
MKVLVTGGYGFIGSHVAERFHKEGYEVFIIDDLSSGKLNNVNFKHRGYQLSVEDQKCEEIFSSNRFDAVVHLAAQVNVATSVENPRQDAKSNVLGLINMLSLASKYSAKKFIFASSAAVYGTSEDVPLPESAPCSPISPYGMSKWVGETYCQKWRDLYGLETLCFRFSNVYGPRQNSIGEGGVISIFADRIIAGQNIHIHGDGEQTRDFIYVEDIADAIYRASYSQLMGVYNLSTQTETSVNSLIRLFEELHGTEPDLIYQGARSGDIHRSVLSNENIKKDLDWTPMYGLRQGLTKTYEWFKQQHSASLETTHQAPTPTSRTRYFIQVFKPYLENLLAFILISWLTLSQWDMAYSFIDIKMFYITIIGILYGNRQSIMAVALSVCLLTYQRLLNGHELVSMLYDTDFFFQIAIYLCIGLVVGYAVERKNGKIASQDIEIKELGEKYEFLNGVYREVREVKNELQQRIMNSGDSFGKIHSITKELDSLEPDEIFVSTVNVIESIMNTRAVSIYIANSNRDYLRLVAHSMNIGEETAKSLKVEEHDYVGRVFLGDQIYVNRELKPGVPLMVAPVQRRGETVAIIALDDIPFENFSLYYQNLFKITVELVSSSLSRAFSYVEATESLRYVEDSSILTNEVFQSILRNKRMAKEKLNINYSLLIQSGHVDSLRDFSNKLKGLLRETDYIGLGAANELMILLSNTGPEDVARILERFAERNIFLKILEEEVTYG